jgi:hypothetical protein
MRSPLYDTGAAVDACSERIRSIADGFYSTRDPHEPSRRVRADGVDILADLAGDSMGPDGAEGGSSAQVDRVQRVFCCYRPRANQPPVAPVR